MTKTRPFLSTCYGYPSTTEVPPCCQAATKKLTFSTTSVLLLLNVPLSLSRGTVFRRQKNPRRGYRPKIAVIVFVCNEPEGKYYTVPISIRQMFRFGQNKHGRRFGQKIWTFRPKNAARFGQNIFNSFTESDTICRRIHRINSLPIKLPAISFFRASRNKIF